MLADAAQETARRQASSALGILQGIPPGRGSRLAPGEVSEGVRRSRARQAGRTDASGARNRPCCEIRRRGAGRRPVRRDEGVPAGRREAHAGARTEGTWRLRSWSRRRSLGPAPRRGRCGRQERGGGDRLSSPRRAIYGVGIGTSQGWPAQVRSGCRRGRRRLGSARARLGTTVPGLRRTAGGPMGARPGGGRNTTGLQHLLRSPAQGSVRAGLLALVIAGTGPADRQPGTGPGWGFRYAASSSSGVTGSASRGGSTSTSSGSGSRGCSHSGLPIGVGSSALLGMSTATTSG